MAEDVASHRTFRVYPLAGTGAGANDPDALTDEQADEAVAGLTWPELAQVRLWRPDMPGYLQELKTYATPFEHASSSLVFGQGDIPVVNQDGEVVMYVGWHAWSSIDVPTALADRFSLDRFSPGMDAQDLVKSHSYVSPGEDLGAGMQHPDDPETKYLLLTTIDGAILDVFQSAGIPEIESSSIQPGDILMIAALLRALGAAALDLLLKEAAEETEEQVASAIAKRIRPVNGTVNVGGGFETRNVTNLNPIKPGSGGPSSGIPNHVPGSMEDMAQLFEPGSVQKMWSMRLRFGDVDWAKGTAAAAKVMPSGGEVMMNVWTFSAEQKVALKAAFEHAGFSSVRVELDGAGTMVYATR